MALIPSKQIDKLMSGTMALTTFAATAATSNVVTTPLTTAAASAGSDGAGGTKHMVDEVKRRTGQVSWIDTRTPLDNARI